MTYEKQALMLLQEYKDTVTERCILAENVHESLRIYFYDQELSGNSKHFCITSLVHDINPPNALFKQGIYKQITQFLDYAPLCEFLSSLDLIEIGFYDIKVISAAMLLQNLKNYYKERLTKINSDYSELSYLMLPSVIDFYVTDYFICYYKEIEQNDA